jgi:hypothetical protein
MEKHLTRKIFASWLIRSGVDTNTVDLLCDRVPQSVLVGHYQAPSRTLKDQVLDALEGLEKMIDG